MSAVATFNSLKATSVPEFTRDPAAVLEKLGTPLEVSFDWSAYVILPVLELLGDRGITLHTSQYDRLLDDVPEDDDRFTVLLTPQHREFLPRLDPDAFDDAEFRDRFAEDRIELDPAEAGAAGRDVIVLLHDCVAEVADDEVIVVRIG
ncbi:hypothetical protein Daura_32600 [Dactylosporangium aurantiacum]|uniref:Uncharacterized protein n=1 Tax=Dactylosporangium aurantiacum TaxID=35754 RepID=A0A9Q9MEI6_9ACTN|nr:hypothetical protein [Dactylosporangium aurantiacum]MDG6107181.1 hypothetical protein [Dactylosporangium aurantiacum]UWZ51475.1 hypothetical protein Daura_32600 [Dactylosporangium aurantiacum]